MTEKVESTPVLDEMIVSKIHWIRGHKVMLDSDLAELYGVETKRLKEQVNRNSSRFPAHFMFELTKEENENLRLQNATLGHGTYSKYLPYAFTEHGVLMLSNVLKSDRAIQMSIKIIDVFVKLREMPHWLPQTERGRIASRILRSQIATLGFRIFAPWKPLPVKRTS
jgi:phage regulator Rha-like protein